MKNLTWMSGLVLAVLILLPDEPCAAMSCGEPSGGCPQPTAQKNDTLFFFNMTSRKCYSVQTSGCDGYGWGTYFQCWANCRFVQ
ncbi:hypothetical protein V5799_013800 [Amblyomma americanum]|uniref:Secreted protein n=1 Tax=Amblyomma americanum TaxID=6943 RepID=A0AAQ4E4W0_AMBAM